MFWRIFGALLITGGLFTAGYSGYHWWAEANLVKTYDGQAYAKAIKKKDALKPLDKGIEYKRKPKPGDSLGSLIVPKLNARIPLVEGHHSPQLAKGVGHYLDTAFPGETGHSVLAGHRETTFKQIGEIKKGDHLIVTNAEGTFTYSVRNMWITKAEDRTVIVPKEKPILTLITCYPFDMIGSAPERYIVEAELIKIEEGKKK
ncbi:class D sortase [Kroppenstedtia pulmonis]|uniref:Class D sortase n=1 Tax=Kroppenstedtia pulmonis TaxID=1380685 RepID=A0A7D4BLZ2_9BACL|nr:class D sortase [Kroppenstedtia pulmonis]QKG85650.1 class D sortase [Kroppenstedtia pulmonis]